MRLPPELLLSAYSQGWFPMAHEDGELYWHEPDPRTILPLDAFHIPRSLVRTLKKEAFEIRRDTAFTAVIQACAAPAPGREETWINVDILEGYQNLHRLGYAHSIEAWRDGQLVGGLYGVALRGLFAGESMFSHETDASKVALVHLVQHLRARGFQLLDVQYMTPHLRRFGAVEISAAAYQRLLAKALAADAYF
ncbi:MAG: leucyl/phenylalanyl-tRNA--protein transferase [Chloroflexi bacterium]|nr:leucyl/phenylalanyl-tRNA--protein transferase [Chloroflexota bacterium]MBP6806605.1 leucyl/phenylalanyl-tRNA--protein transferase [Chloroflexota bacterium]MBP7591838.1 leucyl/phenylalanyl-tRNA--protein transferase [Chloroflexota bacterium]